MSNQRPDANWPSVVALKTILHVLGLIPVSGDVELMGGHPTPNLCFGLLPFGFTAGNTRAFLEQQLQHTLEFPPLKSKPYQLNWHSRDQRGKRFLSMLRHDQSSSSSSLWSFPGGNFSKTM